MSIKYVFLVILLGLPWFFLFYLELKKMLHILQLEGYKNGWFFKWLKKNYFSRFSFIYLAPIIIYWIISLIVNPLIENSALFMLTLWFVLNLGLVLYRMKNKKEAKKPLVFTPRAKRLFSAAIILGLLEATLLFKLFWKGPLLQPGFSFLLSGYLLLLLLAPLTLIIANLLVFPLETSINYYYFRRAQNKLAQRKDLKVIGITGSYGKTSTKFITATILKEKYRVLKTPESYNTPMGISKVINNTLSEKDEVFVVEMGARNPGDIKKLCSLTRPQIGILTSIGPTHLETFGSIENVMKTKYELIESLPQNGLAVFNYDNPYCQKLVERTTIKTALYGFNERSELQVKDVRISNRGSSFTLIDPEGRTVDCSTVLLGEHNILNILAGATVAYHLGLTLEEISRGIKKIEPVPHRLQLINPGTGITVIDDAFNSNPDGARAALKVLNQFEGRKIIVTPGMVELGEKEIEENRKLGKEIARVCDYVLLIKEERARPIIEGLLKENFPRDKIFVQETLKEAQNKLQTLLRPGDVVLFENDLPDNY